MKQLYICEKCGATFEDYDKALECESGHAERFGDSYTPELMKRYSYKPGEQAPAEIVQSVEHWNWEKQAYDAVFYRYKLAGAVSAKETAAIMAEYAERREKEEEDSRKWREEWERAQAAKAAAAAEA